MSKVILVDDLNREIIADILVEENLSEESASKKANEYNSKHTCGSWFAKAVPDNYVLYRGMEDLV